MPVRSGRVEKRVRLSVPVEISTLQDPITTEHTSTEDVCSIGVRVVSQRHRQRDERLLVRSSLKNLQALARVVYCQKLSKGRFAVGLQFVGMRVKEW